MESKIIKINNVPHGFYEREMEQFFNQFGQVKKVRLVRSAKTGNSRGFAYIKFKHEFTAKAAVESMHNYVMFEKVLKCRLVPTKALPKDFFNECTKRKPTTLQIHKLAHNRKAATEEKELRLAKKQYASVMKRQHMLSDMGIKFDCDIINMPDWPE